MQRVGEDDDAAPIAIQISGAKKRRPADLINRGIRDISSFHFGGRYIACSMVESEFVRLISMEMCSGKIEYQLI